MVGAPRFRRVSRVKEPRAPGLGSGTARRRASMPRSAGRGLLVSAALLLLCAAACGGEADAPAAGTITPEQVAALLASDNAPVILDVRTQAEFEGGHIPGAINIPHTELPARVEELAADRDSEIVVLCERGGRARSARAVMAAAGFERVLDLTGHMGAWRAGGFPLE
jgi:phage shock protein E